MADLTRVNQEILNGRLWKARDRLFGLFSSYPTSQEIIELIGDVFYKMGDLPAAGRFWYLTERDDDLFREAVQAFEERCGANPGIMLNELPIHSHYNDYGPIALERIKGLIEKCQERLPRAVKMFVSTDELQDEKEPSRLSIWRERILVYFAAFILGGPWLIGLFTLIIWLISLIAPSFGKDLLAHWFDMLNIVKE